MFCTIWELSRLEDISKTIRPGDTLLRKMDIEKGGEIANTLVKLGGIFLALPKIKYDTKKQEQIYEELQQISQSELLERANHVIDELESTTKDLAVKKSDWSFPLAQWTGTKK